ncbi:MAG: trypsin-like peptidase domain-containing protein, partial [bacterium]
MKIQKGFIQIPLLIAIVVGVLVLGSVGYFGVKQYQTSQTEKITKEKLAQEQAQTLQKALEQAQTEIEKLKQGNQLTQENQKKVEKQIQSVAKTQNNQSSPNAVISASDIAQILTGVNLILCRDFTAGPNAGLASGSGSLWNFDGKHTILTNHHVVEHPWSNGICGVQEYDSKGNTLGFHNINTNEETAWNSFTDINNLELIEVDSSDSFLSPQACAKNSIGHCANASELNYSISNLSLCPNQMSLNSPVTIIGFPATTMYTSKTLSGETGFGFNRTVTNGVISSYDNRTKHDLPYSNYYVSAKIDSGNSGGIALSKNNGSLCVLGVPTWVDSSDSFLSPQACAKNSI